MDPWVRKIPWRRKWQSTPVFLPGESHGWRSLVGYSPQGGKESDTTERLHLTSPHEPKSVDGLCAVCLVTQSYPTLCDHMDCGPPGSSVHGDSPGKKTRVCCHAHFQGIFPTQGLNPDVLLYRWILYCLSHHGSPRILEWVACLFSGGISRPRNQT